MALRHHVATKAVPKKKAKPKAKAKAKAKK
jgi:hypothetical protein